MRNIHELIGIIKGIDFDGVINEKEIERLKNWVDRNRNLTYDQEQMNMILLVDKVLNDHVIDHEERETLLHEASKFYHNSGDSLEKIYELNGIIDGILSDGEVNEAEVFRLKEWMDSYGETVSDSLLVNSLSETLNEVLEDGVVTEEEQQILLDLLSKKISDSQFETKIEYLSGLVKEKKNIGVELIDILDNKQYINTIHRRAERELSSCIQSYSGFVRNKEIIFISLVLIAMNKYDGKYYEYVEETYPMLYDDFSDQKIRGAICSILSKYKKEKNAPDRSRNSIINVALENSVVPKPFLANFFEFIFDIYKLNFEYDLSDDLYEDFRFVYDGLKTNMLSEGDDLSIKVTQKTYKLTSATKHLITKEDGLDALIKLSILIAKLIDKRYWNKELVIYNPYLKAGFDKWEKQIFETTKSKTDIRRKTSDFKSKWEPRFCKVGDNVYLVPPVHRVKSIYDYRDIYIAVYDGEKVIFHNKKFEIREIIGGYQISIDKILLANPLGEIRYKLLTDYDVIYDSKNKLFRDYIIFNEKGQELSNNTDFEGSIYVVHKPNDCEINDIYSCDQYCIGHSIVRQGDAIGIGNDVFNFSTMVKPGIFGQEYTNCNLKEEGNDKFLPLYKTVNVLSFEANGGTSKFELVLNGAKYKLSDMKYKVTQRGDISKYIVELEMDQPGIYDIEINALSSGNRVRIYKDSFAYDPCLKFNVELIGDENIRLFIESGLMLGKISRTISMEEFCMDDVTFSIGNNSYSFYLPFDIGIHRIDEGRWKGNHTSLWINDITLNSKITLFDSECDGLYVYSENGRILEENLKLIDKGIYKEVPIGFLNSYKNENKHVLLAFTVDGKKKYSMICYNKCEFDADNTDIIFYDNPKRILVTPTFFGGNRVFFEVFNSSDEKVFRSETLNSKETTLVDGLNSFEEYTFCFLEKTSILQLRKNTLLYQVKKRFYSKKDFLGHVFKIDVVYYNTTINKKFIEKEYRFNKVFVIFDDIYKNGDYRGRIFVSSANGKWYLNTINPVRVELCSDVMDDTMDVYITNEEDGCGLLLDFEKHGIMNALEHKTAPDIFLYTLNLKWEGAI